MACVADIVKKAAKDYGKTVAGYGAKVFADTPRIPTGIFPLDLSMGGGFPVGRVSIIYGPESSNKTNIVLRAISRAQKLYPNKTAVFVDAEGGYDPVWFAYMGVDIETLIVIQPEYAEQGIDLMEAFLYADDVSIVALDSIAVMSSQNEIESSIEKAAVGGASILMSRFLKKVCVSFNRLRSSGVLPPAFIAINQVRTKIGVMFGNPETTPGGSAPKFASSMTLRVYGKNIMDKEIDSDLPAWKETTCVIQKWKVPILATSSEFKMQMISGAGRNPGFIDDWTTLSNYLKDLGYLGKAEKSGWEMFGETYPTLNAARERLYGSPEDLEEAKSQVIQELLAAKSQTVGDASTASPDDPDAAEESE